MIQVNEYFEGKVKSLTLQANGNKATCGVMAAGEYEFSTGLKEIMTVVAGAMTVRLPGSSDWQTFAAGQKFEVAANSKFQLKIPTDAAYLCEFIPG
ncbi:MAG TPA: pyrimidine/purine nucleoside phosphorylase [Turneriella sp.]|nr:pyrimidine/purine nucleoside phosphorylase [Turneriella sp.]HNE20304.1 pyrimidine/purine nucleoside phosphorylase [Turneriella sp.]HNJ67350.1 pyrimidine/purine nucleoside phosphorylase [Turneriella sp.]